MKFGTILIFTLLVSLTVLSYSSLIVTSNPAGENNTVSIESQNYSFSEINMTPITVQIDGNEEFLQVATDHGWPGTGSEGNPIIISNHFFYGAGIQPVRLWNTNLYWEFRNNIVSSTECGFWSLNVVNGLIADSLFTECHMGNIHQNIKDVTIRNCTYFNVTSNGISIEVGEGLTIINNTIYENGMHGIYFEEVSDSLIMNNTISSNPANGISIDVESFDIEVNNNTISGSQTGVFCAANASEISENTIFDMSSCGVKLFSMSFGSDSASNNTVEGNTFINCNSAGVYIQDIKSSGNIVMENDFFECGSSCQVYDEGTDSLFLNNYFHDWTSPDDDTDGYVDFPYSIAGDSGNEDSYPLASPSNPIPEWYTPSMITTTHSSTTQTSTTITTSEDVSTTTTEESTTPTHQGQSFDFLLIGVAAGIGVLMLGIVILIMKKR